MTGRSLNPKGGSMVPVKAAVLLTLLTVFVAPRALADGEAGETHAIVEAGTSQGTGVGCLEFPQAFRVSVLRLGEAGQGFGAVLAPVAAPPSGGTLELAGDGGGPLTNRGLLYFKPMG